MELICCESCGSIVKREEVRGNCRICDRKTCIACMRICDECLKIVCPNCIMSRELWRDDKHYFRKVCKNCR